MRLLLIIVYILYGHTSYCRAQKPIDTMAIWADRYHIIKNLKLSPDGQSLTVQKWYDSNIDTTMVFDLRTKKFKGNLIGKQTVSFLGNNKLIAFGNGNGEYWDIKNNRRIAYDNVKKAKAFPEMGCYYILDLNRKLSLFDNKANKLSTITNTLQIPVDDGKKSLFVVREDNGRHSIVRYSESNFTEIYTTSNNISQINLSNSGKYLFFLEIAADHRRNIAILNANSGEKLLKYDSSLFTGNMQITEIKDGKAFFINIQDRLAPEDRSVVDIWYGKENDFKEKRYGKLLNTSYLWSPTVNNLIKIPNNQYSTVASINNDRYLLAFSPSRGHNYLTYLPQLAISLYDIESKKYIPLAEIKGMTYGSPEVICSPVGGAILVSEDGKKWSFFDLKLSSRNIIDQEDLRNPVFSMDGKQVFFESHNDLWGYDVNTQELKALKIADGRSVQIINQEKKATTVGFNFFITSVDSKKPLLIRTFNKMGNETGYTILKNNKAQDVIPPTKERISDITFDENINSISFIKENFSSLPSLYLYNGLTKTILPISEGLKQSRTPIASKQVIVEYNIQNGNKLKGILYYPSKCDVNKKYPMIVHIYQVQNEKSADYIFPSYASNGSGFDIATLLQNGYFVYLPDIIYDVRGTGISALDCVNNALDALKNVKEIDMTKVGLIGESHGGYETNFIATTSNRFAAYISGAGNSDLVRSYFSYNYNFNSPFYWQYENGQYELNIPFVQNKNLYLNNSPIMKVEGVTAPILLWAGKKDENIAWDQSMEFYIGLKRNNKTVIALFYPEQGHSFENNSAAGKDLFMRMLDWWDYFLKDKKDITWIKKQLDT